MNTSSVQVVTGLPGLLLVLFIALKLTGQIAWSWWWVLAPLWGPAALVLGFLFVLFILGSLFNFADDKGW